MSQDTMEKQSKYCCGTTGFSMSLSCSCMSQLPFVLDYLFKDVYIGKQREDLLTVQNIKGNVSLRAKASSLAIHYKRFRFLKQRVLQL